MGVEEAIRKHALKNALDYGKAEPKAIVGKVIGEFPDAKKDIKKTMESIKRIVDEVNLLSKDEIEEETKKYSYLEKKEEKKGITLPNGEKGKVVTRFPPEPSGYPHIGHAKAAFLDCEAARGYEGKFILRFDDTNPEKEKEEYVNAIKEGLSWLGIRWDEEAYVSDFMPKLYGYAEKMIGEGNAYVCTCSMDEIKKNRAEKKECKCRGNDTSRNMELWKKMLDRGFRKGEAILRFKGDMGSLNTVMRDPTLFRIIDTPHFRQGDKYAVWPSYDFEVSIIDSITGVTHAMRTKEYELRDELYFAILEKLGLEKPALIEFSRLDIKDAPISKRLLIPLIEEKKVSGWDDPRLPTLAGLRKRGILPQAIKNFVLSFGISKVESRPGWDALLHENKKLIDPISSRYYFVKDPVSLAVLNAPKRKAKLRKHPTHDMGTREMETDGNFSISKDDFDSIKAGEVFRLKGLYNVKATKKEDGMMEGEYAGEEVGKERKIQWVTKDAIKCNVLVPLDLFAEGKFNEDSMMVDRGECEMACSEIRIGGIIQFERYGFCRFDRKEGDVLLFIFTSK